ncbi:MAG: hypothetical protein R2824_12175 [Saprospiraceae bacterium]
MNPIYLSVVGLVFLVYSCAIAKYEIKAKVIDRENGKGIPLTTISTKKRSVESDIDGKFTIISQKNKVFRFSGAGYYTAEFFLSPTDSVILLTPVPLSADSLIIKW